MMQRQADAAAKDSSFLPSLQLVPWQKLAARISTTFFVRRQNHFLFVAKHSTTQHKGEQPLQ
jgi:hypothetical protein